MDVALNEASRSNCFELIPRNSGCDVKLSILFYYSCYIRVYYYTHTAVTALDTYRYFYVIDEFSHHDQHNPCTINSAQLHYLFVSYVYLGSDGLAIMKHVHFFSFATSLFGLSTL